MKKKKEEAKNKQKTPEKQERNKRKLFMGNSRANVKENNIEKLFGLATTKYLKDTCSLNMPMN